ncbi:hypothetical protein [Mesorhizobium huakuii]|uniref:hypothetical protein n=1 Tax=Mesorhizobium huakuii TaxID=28104 RepID=UPI00160F15FD|nr:hypothetical protein [Mesorhizobium huakuii]
MAELVAELVGELRPIPLADVHDDPGHAAAVRMQPDGRRARSVFVDTQPRRLAVGDEADAIEAGMSHSLDDLISRALKHAAPVAGKLDGRGEEGWRLAGRGRFGRHGCVGFPRVTPSVAGAKLVANETAASMPNFRLFVS